MTLPVCNVCGRSSGSLLPDGRIEIGNQKTPPIKVRVGELACQHRRRKLTDPSAYEWCPGTVIVEAPTPLPV